MAIINTWDQLSAFGGDRIAISYQACGDSRSMTVPGWHVWRLKDGKSVATDPKAAWYDYGKKFFSCGNRGSKKTQLAIAMTWARETYGPREFVRNRSGAYVEKEVNEKFPIPKRQD